MKNYKKKMKKCFNKVIQVCVRGRILPGGRRREQDNKILNIKEKKHEEKNF